MAEVETTTLSEAPSTISTRVEEDLANADESSTALTTTYGNSTVSTVENGAKKTKKIIRKKRRPARPQCDPAEMRSEPPPQTGTVFNLWYNKWSGGDREDKYLSQTKAKGRCNIAQDNGFTKADRIPGSYFCLFFARGVCPKGQDCEYLHRLPGIHDHFNPNVDCFGRDRFSDYRDDMGGVGSFMRRNRTLYVGRIAVTDDIEEVVSRHFQEWGEIERQRVLTGSGFGFVTYANEANAQFAKEAMAHQSLDNEEILNVRWATQDPNPLAQKREARLIEEQAAEAVRRALPADFVAEIEGRSLDSVKRQRIEGGYGSYGYNESEQPHALQGNGAPPLLEGPSGSREEDSTTTPDAPPVSGQAAETPTEPSGILSSSTLAALRGYSAKKPGDQEMRKEVTGLSGPLVGYGSNEDSD